MENVSLLQKLKANPTLLFLTVFAMFVFFLLIVLPLLSTVSRRSQEVRAVPSPTQVPEYRETRELSKYDGLAQAVVGKTSEQELLQHVAVMRKENLDGGKTKYVVKAKLPGLQSEIITDQKMVVFETTPVFTSTYGPLSRITDYMLDHGQPEEEIKGNKRWGWNTSSYLYPAKGLAFVANTYTHEIYEVMTFTPMSLTNFKATYPEYIESISPSPDI